MNIFNLNTVFSAVSIVFILNIVFGDEYVPPTITLNTEIVVECDFRDSGVFFQFLGKTSNFDKNEYCYKYSLTRYGSLWNCDTSAAQTWSYLILDPCPNTPNTNLTTFLLHLQNKLSNISSGSLGAYFDNDWKSEGYLFENNDLGQGSIHINVELCLNDDLDIIDNGNYCFYSYYKENATIEDLKILPSGRLQSRPRRGRLDILNDGVRRRGTRRRMLNGNNRKLMSQVAEDRNLGSVRYSYDEFSNEAGVSQIETVDTVDTVGTVGTANDEAAAESESSGNGGVTYYVCASEKVSVPDVCGEGAS